MQIPSDQFKFPIDSVDSERTTADFEASIDQMQKSQIGEKPSEPTVGETREDRVARVREDIGDHLWSKEPAPATPEQSAMTHRMEHLGRMSDVLRSYQDQELSR